MITFHDKLPNPVQKVGEAQIVKTPLLLVESILDGFPVDVWNHKELKWLAPVSKTGVFELGIYKRLMGGLAASIPDANARRDWIVREMIWSFCPTPACELLVRRNYLGKVWNNMSFAALEGNVQTRDFLSAKLGKNGEVMVKKEADGKETYVKFHNGVGNPPYQDNSKANDPKNIYPDFVRQMMRLKLEHMSMVIPARWMMGSGKGSQEFLDEMMASKQLSNIVVEKDASKWFPDVEIKGGTMYFLMNAKHNSHVCSINGTTINLDGEDCIIDNITNLNIKTKVMSKTTQTFADTMLGGAPFEIRSTHKEWSLSPNGCYTCHNSGKGDSDKITFIAKNLVKRNVEIISKYKVCVGAGSGSGSDGTTKPFVIGPDHVVSQSFLVMGCYDSQQEADNAAAYLELHVPQFLVSLLKNTQNLAKRVFKWLPVLDFSRSYTNQDLYTMFALSKDEIAHIENTTKDFPMFKVKIPKAPKVAKKAAKQLGANP